MTARLPWRTFAFVAVLGAIDAGGARALDAMGLVESALAPGAAGAVVLVAAALFYVARLLFLFVAPGLVLYALLRFTVDRATAGRAKRD